MLAMVILIPLLVGFKINGVVHSVSNSDDGRPEAFAYWLFSYGPIDVYCSMDRSNLEVGRDYGGQQRYHIGQPESSDDTAFWTTACKQIASHVWFGFKFYVDKSELVFFEPIRQGQVACEITALQSELARLAYK